tara:strand:+ start:52 stop:237 length:186 start_codon:yes stop_codon:yes gene_type:complete
MQITKNTSKGKLTIIVKILAMLALVIFIIFFSIFVVGKIDFPTPNKKIEKIIPNENFKTIK